MNVRSQIGLYLALTLLLSAGPWYLFAQNNQSSWATLLLMWAPGLAALLISAFSFRGLRSLGWHLGPWWTWVAALVLPWVYVVSAYGGFVVAGAGEWDQALWLQRMVRFPYALAGAAFLALGEELGWRGFLQPKFAQISSHRRAVAMVAVVWGLWHVPVIVWGGYNGGTPLVWSLVCFSLAVAGGSLILGVLRLCGGSVWVCALYHAAHNLLIQGIFHPTVKGDQARWWLGEFGIGLTGLLLLTGLIFWVWAEQTGRFLPQTDLGPSGAVSQT